jgi:tetratricopeptide (TPR) repeat protein
MFQLRSIGLVYSALLLAPITCANAAEARDPLVVCVNSPDDSVALPACLDAARDARRSASDRAVAYAVAGLTKFTGHENDRAMDYFRQALALDKNSDLAYDSRAVVEMATGDYDAAVTDARRAIELKPNGHPDAYLLLGTLADRNGDHDARIAYIDKAIALAPNYAEAYAGRGHGYMDEKKYDRALADFNKAISLKPELAPTLKPNFVIIYIERASNAMSSGQYQAGIEDLSRALQMDPQNVRALGDLGDAYNTTHQYDKAVTVLTQDIQTHPNYPFAYTNRGIAYLNMGKYDLALADLDQSIGLGDHAYPTYFVRGEVYLRKADRKSALADFQKALDLAPPDNPDRAHIQAAIDNAQH